MAESEMRIVLAKNVFFVVGLRRSGTSILRNLMRRHPMIANIEFEPHPLWAAVDLNHFGRFKDHPIVGLEFNRFNDACERAGGLLYGAKFALNPGIKALEWVWLKRTFPFARFVFITRPTNQTWASYEREDADSVRGLIEKSAYMRLAGDIQDAFVKEAGEDPGQMTIVEYGEVLKDANKAMNKVFAWLGIPEIGSYDLRSMIKTPKHGRG